jgi:ketosteroid isomerase-like protein
MDVNPISFPSMRKLFLVILFFSGPVLANENEEARIKAAVEDRYQEWLAAENKKDAAAITDLCDENAVLMPKAEEPVLGKAAIGEYYKKLVANPNFVPFTLALNWNSFHLVGDIAIATALFEGDVTRNGKQIHFRGKDLIVWKKQADGSWKIFRYMYDEIPAKR